MAGNRIIRYNGRNISVPADATDDEVAQIIDAGDAGPRATAPTKEPPGLLQRVWNWATSPTIDASKMGQHPDVQRAPVPHPPEHSKALDEYMSGMSSPAAIASNVIPIAGPEASLAARVGTRLPGAILAGSNIASGISDMTDGHVARGVAQVGTGLVGAHGATSGLGREVRPLVGKVARVGSDIVDPELTGVFSPRLGNAQRLMGRLADKIEKEAAPAAAEPAPMRQGPARKPLWADIPKETRPEPVAQYDQSADEASVNKLLDRKAAIEDTKRAKPERVPLWKRVQEPEGTPLPTEPESNIERARRRAPALPPKSVGAAAAGFSEGDDKVLPVLYHGTLADKVAGIKEQGLQPNLGDPKMPGYGRSWMSADRGEAMKYAAEYNQPKGGAPGALLTIGGEDVPRLTENWTNADQFPELRNIHMTDQVIPPSSIKDVTYPRVTGRNEQISDQSLLAKLRDDLDAHGESAAAGVSKMGWMGNKADYDPVLPLGPNAPTGYQTMHGPVNLEGTPISPETGEMPSVGGGAMLKKNSKLSARVKAGPQIGPPESINEMASLGRGKKFEDFPPKVADWDSSKGIRLGPSGFIGADGRIYRGGYDTAIHDMQLRNAGVPDEEQTAFKERNNLMRFSSGDYFEYPFAEVNQRPTEEQIGILRKLHQFATDPLNGWDKSGLELQLPETDRFPGGMQPASPEYLEWLKNRKIFKPRTAGQMRMMIDKAFPPEGEK